MDAESIGHGGAGEAKRVNTTGAGRSQRLKKKTPQGRKPIVSEPKTSAAQDLQILQQAAFDLTGHGMIVKVYQHPRSAACIILVEGAGYCGKCQQIRLAEQMNGETCQYCTDKVSGE